MKPFIRKTIGSANPTRQKSNWLTLALLSLFVGAGAGLFAALFRLSLSQLDLLRTAYIGWAHGWSWIGFCLVVGSIASMTALAAWLVRRFSPQASGSGIPYVEAVLDRELTPASLLSLPVKFLGGLLAIGAGLMLGREGPSVQMGANLGALLGKRFRLVKADMLTLMAAGAGAGLAASFNAPIAGAVFVLEELVRRFELKLALAALGASAAAISVSQLFFGQSPDFIVAALPNTGLKDIWLFVAFGAVAGLVGAAYNLTLLGVLATADRLPRWPVEIRAAIIGVVIGALAWVAPGWVGGGDALTQNVLTGGAVIKVLPLLFIVRFCVGALSYGAGTPGGLFAPMLVLGAQLGWFFAIGIHWLLPGMETSPLVFAVAGMAAFFCAVVRAPLTGIILALELTGSFNQMFPILWACFAAMLVTTLLNNRPIYDSLKDRTLLAESHDTQPN
jgi:CIC family chloride channel protein